MLSPVRNSLGAERQRSEEDEQDDQAACVAPEDVAEGEDPLRGLGRRARGGSRRRWPARAWWPLAAADLQGWHVLLVSVAPVAPRRAAAVLARRSTSSSVAPAAGSSPATVPSRMTSTRSASPSTSGRYDETTITPRPFGREVADDLVDLGLGADVDALGRLVEHQHLRLRRQPAGQQHLLLVAARQRATPAAPSEPARSRRPPRYWSTMPRSRLLVDDPEARDLVEVRQRGVLADRELEQQPELLAVLGQQAHARPAPPGADRRGAPSRRRPRCGRPRRGRPRRSPAAARCARSRAAPRCRGSRRRGPRSRSGAAAPSGWSPRTCRRMLADRALARRVQRLDLAPDHRRDQAVVVELGHRLARDEAAVAQDGHAVADLEHLLEVVGDVHHRVALVAQPRGCGRAAPWSRSPTAPWSARRR